MKRVVIVDDSEVILAMVKDALEDAGCDVVAMTEPTTRADFVGEQIPDLVLVDINMPQFYGDDLALFLKEALGISAPIYLFSTLDEAELERRAHECGAAGYICKGWGMERLVSIVRDILDLPGDSTAGA